jgi:GDP-4-dehydro-6-deoxy-D-mannose reductase
VRVLVTGISGFVGPRLAGHLEAGGATVAGTYVGPRPDLPSVDLVEVDLSEIETLRRLIADSGAERIVHLAALSHVGASWSRIGEYFQVNVLGTENLMRAADGLPVLLASSAEVYGAVPDHEQPISEDRPLLPASPYAMSKAAAERLALEHGATVVRMFNLAGPGQAPGFALPGFAAQLAAIAAGDGEAVIRVGNLEARRDFTHVDDAAAGIDLVSRSGEPGEVYNLGSGEALSIREALDLLVDVSGISAHVEMDPERMRPIDLPLLQADAGKLRALGWEPRRGVRQALVDLWREVAG